MVGTMDSLSLDFLLRAKRMTYAGGGTQSLPSRPGARDLRYTEGELTFLDSLMGGRHFAGEAILWRGNTPFWVMHYAGRVLGEGFSVSFLYECLRMSSRDYPCRGPRMHSSGGDTYRCATSGGPNWFSGQELIEREGVILYECNFHGGVIG